MTPRRSTPALGLTLLALAVLAASPCLDPEALLREAAAAYARGDYAAAASLYEQAEARTTDPGLVAFNLAAAKYRLALTPEAGSRQALQEAEQLYRCCLEPGDPRRARALYGLGNSLLRQAPDPKASNLKTAIDCYERCLRDPGADAGLAADTRYNLQKARLLLAQFQPPAGSPEDKPGGEDADTNPRPPERQPLHAPGGDQGTEGRADLSGGASPAQADPTQKPLPTEDRPPPGAGNLEPVPDRSEPTPLSPHDAAEHLKRATRRIVEERQAHRQGRARPPAAGVRDW
jgi:tetratricopeptide (TPR) repeat protein